MQAKKKIKICFIVSFIVLALNILMFMADFNEEISIAWKVIDILYVVCSLLSVIGFLIFHIKPIDFLIKNRKLFTVLVVLSCISSLILGYIALIALFEINLIKQKVETKTIETTGEVLPTYEEIVAKIKELDNLLQEKLITEEEYAIRKQEILNSIVKK